VRKPPARPEPRRDRHRCWHSPTRGAHVGFDAAHRGDGRSHGGEDGEERRLARRRRQAICAEGRKQLCAQRSDGPQHGKQQQPKGRRQAGACASNSVQSHGFDENTVIRTADGGIAETSGWRTSAWGPHNCDSLSMNSARFRPSEQKPAQSRIRCAVYS
jgi:hypothetical protein